MSNSPFSPIGQLEGELNEIKRQLHGKVNSYELSTLTSRMDHLEHSMWEIRSTLDGFRVELQGLQESIKVSP